MEAKDIAANLKPEVIESFKRAIEIGKWPDGQVLSQEQKEICMQAVIAYEYHNVPEDQRTAYMPPKGGACASDTAPKNEHETTIKWQDDK